MTILTVRRRMEKLDLAARAATPALLGAGILKLFDDHEPFHIPATHPDAIEVTCDDALGGYAKKGFEDAGFWVNTPAGAAPDPHKTNLVTLTVTPTYPDNDANYPLGAEATGRVAAKALCGAFVTQKIPPNDDPYVGDPGTSMQVSCDKTDIERVQGGFGAAKFTAVQKLTIRKRTIRKRTTRKPTTQKRTIRKRK